MNSTKCNTALALASSALTIALVLSGCAAPTGGNSAASGTGGSGKVIAECADTEIGLKYAADLNSGATKAAEAWVAGYLDSFTQWDYAKKAFDTWSADFARRFAALRNG